MKKNLILMLLVGTMVGTMLTGCGSKEVETVETVEQTTVVSTVVDEAVEEIEKIEGTQKLDEAETVETTETVEETTEEVTEQATEVEETTEEATEVAEPAEEVAETAEEVAEATTGSPFDDIHIYASAGEAPLTGYLMSTGTNVPLDSSGVTTSVSDSGDGTYMYTLKGTIRFEGAASITDYTECGFNVYDKATGKKIDNASNSGGSATIPEVGVLEFTYFATTNEKYDAVWSFYPTDGKDYAENTTNVSELEAPDVVFFY